MARLCRVDAEVVLTEFDGEVEFEVSLTNVSYHCERYRKTLKAWKLRIPSKNMIVNLMTKGL